MDNFIVSARKYRPATFRSVVGQRHVTDTLQNAIVRGQLAHAYLFCGPRGVGKTTCARIFAKAINCLDPREGGEACGECESCKGFEQGRSFNIHELDAASNNSVDDIRSLTDQVRIPPQLGKYSVYIIDEVHMLSAAAFNAFLKTLEEPPAHAIFILATTEKHKIIPTILSRCQIFDFNRIKVSDGVEYMRYIADEEGVKYDEESLNLIARKADGGMRDALSMFDKAVSFCGPDLQYKQVAQSLNILDYDVYFDVVELLVRGDWSGALNLFDGVLAQGFGGQTFMSGLAGHLRDLLVAKSEATIDLLDVTGPLSERYREQAATVDVGFLFDGISLLGDLDGKIRTATNQRLLVELGLMKLSGLAGVEKKKIELEIPKRSTPTEESVQPVSQESRVKSQESATPNISSAPAAPISADDDLPKQVEKPATSVVPNPQLSTPSSIFGKPIGEIMGGGDAAAEVVEAEAPKRIDPETGAKIGKSKMKFLTRLASQRPRLAVVYESMKWDDGSGMLRLRVSSEALRGEVLRHSAETLALLVKMAGIAGTMELDVAVEAATGPAKPIKLEDKIKHLTEQNPHFTQFRKTLELEIE